MKRASLKRSCMCGIINENTPETTARDESSPCWRLGLVSAGARFGCRNVPALALGACVVPALALGACLKRNTRSRSAPRQGILAADHATFPHTALLRAGI